MDFKITDFEIPDDSPEGRMIEEIMTRDNVTATEALHSVIRAAANGTKLPVRVRVRGPIRLLENPEDVIGSMQGTGIVEIAEKAIAKRNARYSEGR